MALRLTEDQYKTLLKNRGIHEEAPEPQITTEPKKPEKPKSVHIGKELHTARHFIYSSVAIRIMSTPLFWIIVLLCIQYVWPFVIVYALIKLYYYLKPKEWWIK